MLRILGLLALTFSVSAFSASAVLAADKEQTLTGDIVCGKCELKESKACAVAIVVDKDGKKSTYWFDKDSSKKYHGDVCTEVKPGTITGTVKKEGEKNIVTVSKLTYK